MRRNFFSRRVVNFFNCIATELCGDHVNGYFWRRLTDGRRMGLSGKDKSAMVKWRSGFDGSNGMILLLELMTIIKVYTTIQNQSKVIIQQCMCLGKSFTSSNFWKIQKGRQDLFQHWFENVGNALIKCILHGSNNGSPSILPR